MNSSLTLRPRARCWAKRRWCGSEGLRPQIRHGCLVTNLTCSRSRTRRGSGWARSPLSMPSAVFRGGRPRGRRLRVERAGRRGSSGGSGSAWATSFALASVSSLTWNASSIPLASAVVKLLLGPITRYAQVVASSAEPMPLSSAASRSRKAAEASGSSKGGEGRGIPFAPRSPAL